MEPRAPEEEQTSGRHLYSEDPIPNMHSLSHSINSLVFLPICRQPSSGHALLDQGEAISPSRGRGYVCMYIGAEMICTMKQKTSKRNFSGQAKRYKRTQISSSKPIGIASSSSASTVAFAEANANTNEACLSPEPCPSVLSKKSKKRVSGPRAWHVECRSGRRRHRRPLVPRRYKPLTFVYSPV